MINSINVYLLEVISLTGCSNCQTPKHWIQKIYAKQIVSQRLFSDSHRLQVKSLM